MGWREPIRLPEIQYPVFNKITYTLSRKSTPTLENIRQNRFLLPQIDCQINGQALFVAASKYKNILLREELCPGVRGGGGGRSQKGGAQGGRDSKGFGSGESKIMGGGGLIPRTHEKPIQ